MNTRAWTWAGRAAVVASVGCMAATATAQTAASPVASGCAKDVECKGDRICVEGKCVAPGTTPAPVAPAPTSSEAPAAPPPPVVAPLPPPTTEVKPPIETAPAASTSSGPAPGPGTVSGPIPAVSASEPTAPPQMVVLYTPPADEGVSARGLRFGFRFGVGFPAGAAEGSQTNLQMGHTEPGNLSGAVGVILPITFDISYRFNPHWSFGGYFSFAYGTAPSGCASGGTDGASCYETDIRLGLDVEYNFFPKNFAQPWVGVGAGWEILNSVANDQAGDEESGSVNGIEFGHIDLGLDFRLNERQTLGPYFMATVADYVNAPAASPPTSQTLFIHEWLMVGARWRYDTNWLR